MFNGTYSYAALPEKSDKTITTKKEYVSVYLWGNLYQRNLLRKKLNQSHDTKDNQLIHAAWIHWGVDLIKHIQGEFALTVIDHAQQQVFLARDPIGTRPLFYSAMTTDIRFSTRSDDLVSDEGYARAIDLDWVLRYLLGASASHERSPYKHIHKVPPGHSVLLRPGKPADISCYHEWDRHARVRPEEDSVERYQASLHSAIKHSLSNSRSREIGIELSGGLDSSSLAALAAEQSGGEHLNTYSFRETDRIGECLDAICDKYGIQQRFESTEPHNLFPGTEEIDSWLDMLGNPPEHINSLFQMPLLLKAKSQSIKILLSGFGGDECVTSNAWQVRSELFRSGRYRESLSRYNGSFGMRVLRMLKEQIQPEVSTYAITPIRNHEWVRPEAFPQEFEALLNRPLAPTDINDVVIQQLTVPRLAARLETGSVISASMGFRYAWPLLNPDLIQCYLRTPLQDKYGPDGIGRYLHRRAIQNIVPNTVAWQTSKFMGRRKDADVQREFRLQKFTLEIDHLQKNLHPLLSDYLDTEWLRQKLWLDQNNPMNRGNTYMFSWLIPMLRWRIMNRWLHRLLPV